MNFYKRHLGDYAKDAGHLSMLEHGAYTLLLDRYYTAEGPIQKADVYRVTRARSRAEKEATDAVLAEFFKLDGDAYTNRRAEEELAAWRAQAETNRRIAAEREAKKRARTEPKDNNDSLNEPSTNRSTIDQPSQNPESRIQKKSNSSSSLAAETPQAPQSDAGRACRLMREAGCTQTNPSHPVLLNALAAGVSPEALADTAREAVEAGKSRPFLWSINTALGRLEESIANPGAQNATSRPSATDRVQANIDRARQRDREHLAVIEGGAQRIPR